MDVFQVVHMLNIRAEQCLNRVHILNLVSERCMVETLLLLREKSKQNYYDNAARYLTFLS